MVGGLMRDQMLRIYACDHCHVQKKVTTDFMAGMMDAIGDKAPCYDCHKGWLKRVS